MPTVYSDALYSVTNLGVIANSYFGASATNNTVTLLSAGTLAGSNVIGIAYNEADWAAGTSLGARTNISLAPYSSGTRSGDAPTTITVGVSAAGGLTFAILTQDNRAINLTYTGGTLTYAADLSAATRDVSDKNDRRLHVLGYR